MIHMRAHTSHRASRQRPNRSSVSSAERAILDGDKTIGEISGMVSFDVPDLEKGFAPLVVAPKDAAPKAAPFFNQMLWGLQLRLLLLFVMCIGAAAGICIGYAMYGTPAYAAILSSITFSG